MVYQYFNYIIILIFKFLDIEYFRYIIVLFLAITDKAMATAQM